MARPGYAGTTLHIVANARSANQVASATRRRSEKVAEFEGDTRNYHRLVWDGRSTEPTFPPAALLVRFHSDGIKVVETFLNPFTCGAPFSLAHVSPGVPKPHALCQAVIIAGLLGFGSRC